MEEQARELRELLGRKEEQRQLKEMYDEFDRQEEQDKTELKELREEMELITRLLDSFGVPKTDRKVKLSVYERIQIGLKMRLYA